MPAQAGIQLFAKYWAPAFAGATKGYATSLSSTNT
jgi:hypothetical protein